MTGVARIAPSVRPRTPSRSGASCWPTATACSARSHDAEDLVQETYLRAWRSYGGFEGRSSVRTWLYRIATNACLTALAKRAGGRCRPAWATRAGPGAPRSRPAEVSWLQPIPDALVTPDGGRSRGHRRGARRPAAGAHRQPAVPAGPAAGGAHPAGRAGLPGRRGRGHARHHDGGGQERAAARPGPAAGAGPGRRRHHRAHRAAGPGAARPVHRRVRERRRHRAGQLLCADATLEATPFRTWYAGCKTCVPFLRDWVLGSPGDWRMLPTRANGQPAAVCYVRDATAPTRHTGS